MHRITGLLLIAAMVHGFLQDRSLDRSAVLKITYLAMCALGVARPAENILVVTLTPRRDPIRLTPGRYVYAHFGTEGWRPHPFTVADVDDAHRLRLAIQAAGDETAGLYEKLTPGTPVRVFGPHGRFDYRRGGRRQIWIAAGVGITPFHSWIQSLEGTFDREVEFFYTAPRSEAACSPRRSRPPRTATRRCGCTSSRPSGTDG